MPYASFVLVISILYSQMSIKQNLIKFAGDYIYNFILLIVIGATTLLTLQISLFAFASIRIFVLSITFAPLQTL